LFADVDCKSLIHGYRIITITYHRVPYMSGIIIIGAGQTGLSMAVKLKALGYDGKVALIGDEPIAPYQRPPL
jgi:hypothetical protein